jgi:uncharacterized protein (DUF2236 family)
MAEPVLPDRADAAAYAVDRHSVTWRYAGDARAMLGAGTALLLQVSHPTVAAGVRQHSDFRKDPWGRLLRTLDYVHGTIYGGPEIAGAIGARVRNLHRTIKGRRADGVPYHAMEPDAFAWVHATLAASVFEGRRALAQPMDDAERQAFWTQWRDVGRLIGVRYRDLPEDVAGFDAYMARVIEEDLDWTPAVPEVLETLAKTSPPRDVRIPPWAWRVLSVPMARQLTLATTGLLPPVLRERLGLRWSAWDERAWRAFSWASRTASPVVRGPLANFGPIYVRVRRDVLAREVGAAAAPSPRPAAVAAAG